MVSGPARAPARGLAQPRQSRARARLGALRDECGPQPASLLAQPLPLSRPRTPLPRTSPPLASRRRPAGTMDARRRSTRTVSRQPRPAQRGACPCAAASRRAPRRASQRVAPDGVLQARAELLAPQLLGTALAHEPSLRPRCPVMIRIRAGRLFQIEYAVAAIDNAAPAVGVLAKDGIVIAGEKKVLSKLLATPKSSEKMATVDEHIVCAVAGLTSGETGAAHPRGLPRHARLRGLRCSLPAAGRRPLRAPVPLLLLPPVQSPRPPPRCLPPRGPTRASECRSQTPTFC